MRVLGIDPGSRKCGYALIEIEKKKISYIRSGVLKFSSSNISFPQRIGEIYKNWEQLILEIRPDEVALESLIHVLNVSSLSKLAQARGAIIAACTSHNPNINFFEYSPNEIKVAVTGHGHASKEAIQRALNFIIGPMDFKTDDESDALGVAICHGLNRESGKNISLGKNGIPKKRAAWGSGNSLKSVLKRLDKR